MGASRAIGTGDIQAALEALEASTALYGGLHPDLAYLCGKALVEHGGDVVVWRKGGVVLTEFVAVAGRNSKHCPPALQLLLDVEVKLDATARQARLKERLPEILRTVDAQMVRVGAGSFAMGCTQERMDCGADEELVHRVRIREFDIGRHEVSKDFREAVMGEAAMQIVRIPPRIRRTPP